MGRASKMKVLSVVRRVLFKQHTPDYPPSPFASVAESGASYWHAKITDAIYGGGPEFTAAIPKKSKKRYPTPQEISHVARQQCNEGVGRITLTEYRNGVPVFAGIWWSPNTLHEPLCLWSTDHARAKPVSLEGVEQRAAEAIAKHRAAAGVAAA